MHKKIFIYSAFILLIILALVYIRHAYASSKITVTATVPASSNDAVVTLTSSPDNSTLLRQNDEVTFTVSYRSLLSYSTNFVLEASWQQGLISGGNYVDTLNYVLSSATNTDNGAVPVIDLQNRKIRWSFMLAPSANNKTITFKLRVRPDLPTTNIITVATSAQGQIAGAYTPSSTLQYSVKQFTLSSSSTNPTPVPPTPTPTKSPTLPTNIPNLIPAGKALKITAITIDEITNNTARFYFSTSTDSRYSVKYGDNTTDLNQISKSDIYTNTHTVTLESLHENTTYYYMIQSINSNGTTVNSDIFTFKTARSAQPIEIKKEKIDIIADDIPLNSQNTNTVILPKRQSFSINVNIDESKNIRTIYLKIKNEKVLGIDSTETAIPTGQSPLIEVSPGTFSAEILPPANEGTYGLYLEIHTADNSYYLKKLPYSIYISPPLKVYSSVSHRPVENATVTFYKFEPSLKQYTVLTSKLKVPYRTDENGELPIKLPLGSYLIEVKSPGFHSIQKRYELTEDNYKYPEIYLEPKNTLTAKIEYYSSAVNDSNAYLKSVLKTYFSSQRFTDILMIIFFLDLLFIAMAMLSIEAHVGILGILYMPYLFFNKRFKQGEYARQFMHITVHEEGKQLKIISGVRVFILNKSSKVVFKGTSSLLGRLTIPKKLLTEQGFPYTIRAYRAGYFAYPITLTAEQEETHHVRLWMSREYAMSSLFSFYHWVVDFTVSFLSNLIVLLIVGSTVLILYFKGLETAFPFIMASISVTGMWGILLKTSWGYSKEE